jgi:serine/threonine protein kinase
LQNNNPWYTYTRILIIEQTRPVILVSSKTRKAKAVVIKELSGYKMADFKGLIKSANENIVKIYSVFFFNLSIYLIHEEIEAYLNEIVATPKERLPYQEVATIYYSLLSGLNYIYSEINITYGNINSSTVLFNESGQTKIGK